MFDVSSNSSSPNYSLPFCKKILLQEIGERSIRIWDIAILVPNLIFLIFLLLSLRRSFRKLRQTGSLVYLIFYFLVIGATFLSFSRCVVSMSAAISTSAGGIDKILWLLLKFFLIASELSVLTFGLFCGKADRKSSLKRILMITAIVSVIYSTVQALLEFKFPDSHFSSGEGQEFDLFSHGGMIFWMSSSAVFVFVYVSVCVLPFTSLGQAGRLPQKKSFYYYCGFLAILNGIQVAGSALVMSDQLAGMCLIDSTSFIYFALFIPLVYLTFLHDYFSNQTFGLMFSYHPHEDEVAELPVPTGYPVGSMYSSESDDFLLFKDPLYDTTNLYLSPHNEVSNFRAKPIQEVKGAVFLYTEEDPMVSTEFPERNRSLSKAEDAVTTDIASSASRSAAAALLPPPIPRLAGRIEKRSDIT